MSIAALPALLLVPPLNCLAAACAGALLLRHRTGRLLLAAGLVSLIVLGLPVTSRLLLFSLEQNMPLTPSLAARPSAIVILSGDETAILVNNRRSYALGGLTLEREAAGAQLAHQTGLPILVSGGQIHRDSQALATLMQGSLQRSFGLVPAWAEKSSVDTWRERAKQRRHPASGGHPEYLSRHPCLAHAPRPHRLPCRRPDPHRRSHLSRCAAELPFRRFHPEHQRLGKQLLRHTRMDRMRLVCDQNLTPSPPTSPTPSPG